MNTFASFFKKKPSQEEMETMIAGVMTASSEEQPAGQDSICFFAYIIEPDREYSELAPVGKRSRNSYMILHVWLQI